MSCKIFTVNPYPVVCEMGPAPDIHIKPMGEGKKFGYTIIEDYHYTVDRGNDKFDPAVDSAEKLAKDILARKPGLGLFLADSEMPANEEIEKAKADLIAADMVRISKADASWDSNHKRSDLNTEWIRAARRQKINRVWAEDRPIQSLVPCKVCTQLIPVEAYKCPNCHEWLKAPPAGLVASPAAEPARAVATR